MKKTNNKKNNTQKIVAAFIPLVLIIVFVVILVIANGKKNATPEATPSSSTSNAPTNVTTPTKNITNGGINVSKTLGISVPKSAVTVDVYFDYMCPACGIFDNYYEGAFTQLMNDKEIQLILHPINMLDESSQGTRYSTRAGATAYLIAAKSPKNFWNFTQKMMAQGTQPSENSPGLSNEEIASIASTVGVPSSVASQINNQEYADYMTSSTNNIMQMSGFSGTPDIRLSLNGDEPKTWTAWSGGNSLTADNYKTKSVELLTKAIENIKAGKDIN